MPFANQILGGQNKLIRPAIQSPDFVHGSAGWSVNKDGSAEFNDATIRGTITASVFEGTDFVITAAGAFFYSGSPGPGNTPVIWSAPPTVTVDPFGNTLPASGGSVSYVALNTQLAGLLGGQLRLSANPGQQQGIITAGGLSTYGDLQVSSPYSATGGDVPGEFMLTSAAYPGGGTPPQMIMGPGTVIAAGLPGGTFPQPETWHNMTLLNSWANNASFAASRYKMMPDNCVRVQGVINATAATAPTFFTLPAAYRPTRASGAAVGSNSGVTAGTAPQLRWDTSGDLSINSVTIPSASAVFFTQDIPLD